MALLENLLIGVYVVLAAIVGMAAWRAWRYARTRKVLLLALAFTVLLAKAVFLSIGLFFIPEWETLFVPSLVLDLIVLVLFYMAVLHRAG